MFEQSPQIRVDVTGRAVAGEFVVPEETVSGSGEAAPRPTVVVYQVAGGKIARAWFLP